MALSVIELNNILDGKEIANCFEQNKKTTIVCPNPALADELREALAHYSKNFQTVTIAKFTSDLLEYFYDDKKVMRKSELKLLLSTLWKIRFKDTSGASFDQCFDILTDLRSYTLESHLVESVLERLSSDVAECVRYFWLLMENQEIIDEHLGQDLLTQYLEKTDIDDGFNNGENYMFIGFSHLSSNQINFLRALGRRFEVAIPIGKRVLENARPSDWITWVVESANFVKAREVHNTPIEIKTYRFPKGNLASALSSLPEDFDHLVLPTKNITNTQLLELPSKNYFFKTSNDLVSLMSLQYFDDVEQTLFYDISNTYDTEDFIHKLEGQKKAILNDEKSFKTFLRLKIVLVFIENIVSWREFSEVNNSVTHFDYGVLRETVTLDLPRLFNIPLKEHYSHQCIGHQNLFRCYEKTNVVCLTSGHDLSGGEGSHYPFEVSEVLKTLGPMRQKTLDSLIVMDQILSLAKKGDTTFLIESGIEVHDAFMEKLLSKLSISEGSLEHKKIERVESSQDKENAKTKVEVLSPTRLQSYIDCPKKYDYNYNLDLGVEPEKESLIDPRHLGSLEHLVFEKMLLGHIESDIHTMIIDQAQLFFPSEVLSHKVARHEIIAEVIRFVAPVVDHFKKLQGIDPHIEFVFEKKLYNSKARGRVDLIVKSQVFGNILIDMKRSSSSIPTKSSLEKMQSIQIWYYLNFLKEYNISTFGYLSFAEPESSLFIGLNSDYSQAIMETGFLAFKKIDKLKNPVEEYLLNFNDVYEQSIQGIDKNVYPVAPIGPQSCSFCPGGIICPKA